MDVLVRIDKWLELEAPTIAPEEEEAALLLIAAEEEIEKLRDALLTISNLGSNAPDGSFLEECSILASSALMVPINE